MLHRHVAKKHYSLPWRITWLLSVLVVLTVSAIIIVRHVYTDYLRAVSNSQITQIFTVTPGSSVKQIAAELETAHLIRSAWAFQLYVHSHELNDRLQAGTYALSPSQSTAAIVARLIKGQVATDLVTILPGRRIDQVRADLINDGFSPSAVDRALNPATYADLPVLAYKPQPVTTLEGLLWPDSYQRQSNTDPTVIIRESLVAMGQQLTPDVQAAFATEGLTTYQGLTLASIIDREVSKPNDQAQVAQVFLSRLKLDMPLGSDPTAKYGAILAGQAPSLTYDSAYNTLLHAQLPPTPISTISTNALTAATHPTSTNWLYFVSGDDGTTYFSTTIEDHQALTEKYCHKLCNGQ